LFAAVVYSAGGRLRTMSAKIGSFVKKSFSRNMGHKIGKLPRKSEELAALPKLASYNNINVSSKYVQCNLAKTSNVQ